MFEHMFYFPHWNDNSLKVGPCFILVSFAMCSIQQASESQAKADLSGVKLLMRICFPLTISSKSW